MTLLVDVCTACGTAVFPPRVLCRRCGGRERREAAVERGVLEAVTERDGTRIGEVRIPLGPAVVARVVSDARCGDEVELEMIDGVPTAS
jgi:uncharacterized OB-fold protein